MISLPSVDGVRLATADDLDRIAIVAASAFFWSPTFKFQRPRYNEFPADTVASYRAEYEAAIQDPACAVLVAEDAVEKDEADHVYEALQYAYCAGAQAERVIVGVSSIHLKPNSCFLGHFQPSTEATVNQSDRSADGISLARASNHMRDQCADAIELYNATTQRAKFAYLHSKMRLSTLAVAPAYWRRGHATRLVDFCTQLADSDSATVGVSATPCGALVMARAGFQKCELVKIRGPMPRTLGNGKDALAAADVQLWIGLRLPYYGSSSSGIVSPVGSPTSSDEQ